ncbi:hypothetical protein E4V42_13520 [Clostridium estertheticum]|uniref:Uncharacterized protein n=2 Tax=Clostridium estertheticum TaxID=238834 RepID=A0A5N7J2Z2_9CLOT|nr:hypothetical protein [Clostridium estertheticum]MPQ63109.1 hypothetical protein [Clostridium estertheticum]
MMLETKQTYMGENKTILQFAGELFQNTSIKVKKSDVVEVASKRILKAGSIVDNTGKIVADETAFGLVYRDVDFTLSNGTENIPITIFGFVKTAALPIVPTELVKSALNMIKFL